MKKIFPDKTPEYSFIWLEEISEDVPCAVLALRQKIAGIPVLMGAGDPVAYASEEEIGFPKPDRSDAAKIQLCNRLEADEKMIFYLDGTCRMEIEPIQKTEQLEEDVPVLNQLLYGALNFVKAAKRDILLKPFGFLNRFNPHSACSIQIRYHLFVCFKPIAQLLSRCGGRKCTLSGVAD